MYTYWVCIEYSTSQLDISYTAKFFLNRRWLREINLVVLKRLNEFAKLGCFPLIFCVSLKEALQFLKRFLNLSPVRPTHFYWPLPLSTVTWYMMLSVRHLLFWGHLDFTLQFHIFSGVSGRGSKTDLLWALILPSRFGVHE